MITSITNTPRISPIQLTSSKSNKTTNVQSFDEVAFKGVPKLVQTKNKAEIKELVDLFYNSYAHTVRETEDIQQNWFQRFFNKISSKIGKSITIATSQDTDSITTIAKSTDGKIVGGYSMYLDKEETNAVVDFLTLAPELKGTKKGIKLLFQMGEEIHNVLQKEGISEIIWCTEAKNQNASRLFDRLNPCPKYQNPIFNQENYIYTSDLKLILNDLTKKYKINEI